MGSVLSPGQSADIPTAATVTRCAKTLNIKNQAPCRQGTYFVLADHTKFGFADDFTFCEHLIKEVGVAAIPPSAFYSNPSDGKNLVRFAFCKDEQTLIDALKRMSALSS